MNAAPRGNPGRSRLKTLLRVIATLLVAAPALASSAPRGDLSGRERIGLPPADQDRLARSDLLSLLGPVRQASTGMFHRLRGVDFTSRAYATGYAGVCGRGQVTLWYASVSDRDQSSNAAPLHPYRISVASSFHIINAITAAPDRREEGAADASAQCGRLATEPATHWTEAASADDLVDGTIALALAAKQVRDGRLHDCGVKPGGSGACGDILAAAGAVSELDSVERCPSAHDEGCFELFVSGQIKIKLRAHLDGSQSPDAIESAEVSSYIVVT